MTDAAEALTRTLRALDDFDDDAPPALSSAPVREALGDAITDYLDVRLTATADPATVRPGDALDVRVRVANGARRDPARRPRALTGAAWPRPGEARVADRLGPRARRPRASRSPCRRRSHPATSTAARGCATRSTAPRSTSPRRSG